MKKIPFELHTDTIYKPPDIEEDLEVQIALPRRRPFKKTLHRVTVKTAPQQEAA